MPLSCTFFPGAWPIITILLKALACKTGLGVHGKKFLQTVHFFIVSRSFSNIGQVIKVNHNPQSY
jgi:hypothetical protein